MVSLRLDWIVNLVVGRRYALLLRGDGGNVQRMFMSGTNEVLG